MIALEEQVTQFFLRNRIGRTKGKLQFERNACYEIAGDVQRKEVYF